MRFFDPKLLEEKTIMVINDLLSVMKVEVNNLDDFFEYIDSCIESNETELLSSNDFLIAHMYAAYLSASRSRMGTKIPLHELVEWAALYGFLCGKLEYKIELNKMHLSGVKAKLANDPKQADKLFVKECWDEWQTKPHSYKSQAKFARAMLDKCEHLENQVSIENWCREWKKALLS